MACSISVAKICQLYPNKSSFDIIKHYFEIYSKWEWPQPVLLRPVIDLQFNHKVWDPVKHPMDRMHRMPVITPAYPSMCSTHNITKSTFDVILSEFNKANEILNSDQDFTEIFSGTGFFRKYKVFVEIAISCEDTEAFKQWEGFIESKIRLLAVKLENAIDITGAVPFPKAFKSNKNNSTVFIVGIETEKITNGSKKIYVDVPIKEFIDLVNNWINKVNKMKIDIQSKKKKEIQEFLKKYYSE